MNEFVNWVGKSRPLKWKVIEKNAIYTRVLDSFLPPQDVASFGSAFRTHLIALLVHFSIGSQIFMYKWNQEKEGKTFRLVYSFLF